MESNKKVRYAYTTGIHGEHRITRFVLSWEVDRHVGCAVSEQQAKEIVNELNKLVDGVNNG